VVSNPLSAGLWLAGFIHRLGFGPNIAGRIISVTFVGPMRWPPFASGVAVVTDIHRFSHYWNHPVANLGFGPGSNAVSSSSWLVDALGPWHLACCCRYASTGRTCHRWSRHH